MRAPMADGAGDIVWHMWEAAEQPSGPPVVLFHGGSGSWTHWVKNVLPLRDAGREVWAVDLPGFGDSDLPAGGRDADAVAPPLAASLQQVLPGVAVDLVGFSFGAMTAALLLAAHPQLARRLVLVGAPAMGVVAERQFQLRGWRHLPTEPAQLAVHRHNLAALMLHEPQNIDTLALEVHTANVWRDRMPRRQLAHTDILARSLGAVACPVHAIYGAHDAIYGEHIQRLPEAFRAATPCFQEMQCIIGAGHWVQFEAPAAFHAALSQVLAQR